MQSYPYVFRRTTNWAIFLASCLAGLGLGRLPFAWGLPLATASGLLLLLGIKLRRLFPLALVVFGVTLGGWRGATYLTYVKRYDSIYKQTVVVIGVAQDDAIYGDKSQLSFGLGKLHVVDPEQLDLAGKVGVKGFGEYMVYKGDSVQITGKLRPTRGANQATTSFAKIRVLGSSHSKIEQIRRRFEAGIHSALPEPAGSFGLGLLVGLRSSIPLYVNQQLSTVGLSHVVAVSGYNLTIILRAVRRLLKRRSKYQATIVSLLLIGMFLLFTGLSASIVRAALVSSLSLWAWYYGRSFRPIVLILLVATTTAWLNPLYLWSDIGWYLSFLAFFGVMIIGPMLGARLFKGRPPKLLASLIIETSSAQIMTIPIILYIFGQFSVIALVANILVVPLVPLGMLGSLLAGMAGMITVTVAGWAAWPARLLITYMLDVVSALSHLPKSSIALSFSLVQMICSYAIVLVITMVLWLKNRGKHGTIKSQQV